jgi:RNA polymerase sporulation-specific sigma factor
LKTFPKPLSVEEEQYYMKKSREGDMAAREMLILRNMRLVAHVVKKYQCPENEQEELISIGTIGLIKAIATVDTEKGRLSTYAARCIENELLMYFRSRKKLSLEVSISETIDTDKEGAPLTYSDIISVDDTIADDLDLKLKSQRVRMLVDRVLDPREREIIVLRYGLNGKKAITQRETADLLGISRSYVSRIEKAALDKIGKAL